MVRFLVCSLPLVSLVALACISAAIIPGHLSPDSSDTVAHEVDSAVVVDSAVLESVPLTIEEDHLVDQESEGLSIYQQRSPGCWLHGDRREITSYACRGAAIIQCVGINQWQQIGDDCAQGCTEWSHGEPYCN